MQSNCRERLPTPGRGEARLMIQCQSLGDLAFFRFRLLTPYSDICYLKLWTEAQLVALSKTNRL